MTDPIRVKATDRLGNIAYVHRDAGGSFRCTLASGLSASFFYAGIQADEMACRFALDDCTSAEQALAIIKRFGSHLYAYALTGSLPGAAQPDLLTQSLAALSGLETEIQRLKALLPEVSAQVDNRALDLARAVLTAANKPDTSLALAKAIQGQELYLRLYHGRTDPAAQLEEWAAKAAS